MSEALNALLARHPRWLVLTGAGISAASGIPTYRNDRGEWQRSDPIQHQAFIDKAAMRQRYWARSMNGWPYVRASEPNAAHHALAALERLGHIDLLVTQNVDRLHQAAGSRKVVDLHGRLDRAGCLNCGAMVERDAYQQELKAANPDYASYRAAIRPDGDAEVDDRWVSDFRVPPCQACGGVLMPDVVFFGGGVPRERVERIRSALTDCDALLVVGSSLMVYSGFRFCREAVEQGKPLAIINRGTTRADELAILKVEADAGHVLEALVAAMEQRAAAASVRSGIAPLAPRLT
ncbi:MAG: NAD-dependent protein deacetylase [Pseudomonadota bacterium]